MNYDFIRSAVIVFLLGPDKSTSDLFIYAESSHKLFRRGTVWVVGFGDYSLNVSSLNGGLQLRCKPKLGCFILQVSRLEQ